MSWKKRETLGEQIVGGVYDVASPPADWLLNQPDGFCWWPGPLAQRIWTDDGIFRNSRTYYRLHAEIDLVRAGKLKDQLDAILEAEMDSCILSCLLYDKRTDTYRLHSSIYAEAEIAHWINKIFVTAARTQVTTAYRIVDKITETLHPSLAVSSHPTSGVREQRDEVAIEALGPLINEGQIDSRWLNADEWRDVDWAMDRMAMAWQKSDKKSSHSTFLWEPDTTHSLDLFITSEEPHPVLGNGLHFTLTVPLKLAPKHVAYMALELNEYEKTNWLKTHMLGSWSNHNGALAFRLFVPNALYQEGVLHELSVSMAARAIWTSEFFLKKKQEAEAAKRAGVQ